MCFLGPERCLIAGLLLLCFPAISGAADTAKLTARGKTILQEKCGRCHAVEVVGESPLKIAPPMRDIYARFVTRELQEGAVGGKSLQAQRDAADRILSRGRRCHPCLPLRSRGAQVRSWRAGAGGKLAKVNSRDEGSFLAVRAGSALCIPASGECRAARLRSELVTKRLGRSTLSENSSSFL